MAQQKFTIDIDPKYSPRERKAIAQDVIDLIVKRTKAGKDKNNKPFAPYSGKNKKKGKYSASYANSLDFKNAGKSANELNLKLSEDMLTSIVPLSDRPGKITVGFEKGDENNGKAEGNIKGTYGNKSKVTTGRDFLGIHPTDLAKILKKYPIGNDARRLTRVTLSDQATRQSEIISELFETEDLPDV